MHFLSLFLKCESALRMHCQQFHPSSPNPSKRIFPLDIWVLVPGPAAENGTYPDLGPPSVTYGDST